MQIFRTGLILILTSTFFSRCESQTSDCKYLAVIAFLRTNEEANKKIKTYFPKLVSRKDKFIEFNISAEVSFLALDFFKKQLKESDYEIPIGYINNTQLYFDSNFFKTYKSDFLEKVIELNKAKLFLNFSKPVNNFLITEFTVDDPARNMGRKDGLAMELLFIFDSHGLIKNVLYSGSAYD